MLYERLVLAHELLAAGGSFYIHLDWRMASAVRLVLDEIFGSKSFQREIIWAFGTVSGFKSIANNWIRSHDTILFYAKGNSPTVFEKAYLPHKLKYVARFDKTDEAGRRFRDDRTEGRRQYLDESRGRLVGDVWDDIMSFQQASTSREYLKYPTQKPEALLDRIIRASSRESDLVLDFFAGSGTTAAVAEKLNRRWIACDLGRFAIHTTRKRLLNIPDCRPFEIRNLGAYERQRWRQDTGNGALRGYLDTILAFYRAEPVEGFQHLHGRKADRMVHVGATDAPVTIDEAEEVMDELADNGIESCDLLGWEWEMGLHDTIGERARRRGLDVRPLQIPREVMERRVQEADAVRFFELAYVDLDVRRQTGEAKVVLKDFASRSEDLIPAQVRERITVWSDLIDYWSVDFDHQDGVFHNQWQSYRTRAEPVLATESDWHEYPAAGRYAIVVKIIDIFGNDTTKLAEVTIK